MTNLIPVYAPMLAGRESEYVQECITTTWISSRGSFVHQFEENFANYVGSKHAVTVCNGTVALHLALVALGIGRGDKVAVPTFTYIASVNAIRYVGAEPVFIDSDLVSLQISVDDLERKAESEKIRAIIPVHLYGQACNMESVRRIAGQYGMLIVEDCAEAFGTMIGKTHVGNFSDAATWSFFGNKTITTGEGGMVTTNDSSLDRKLRKLRGQGLADDREYWHDTVGYNYRMTNICSAIGVAQLEKAAVILRRKREIAESYRSFLRDVPVRFHEELVGTTHSFWMCSILTEHPSERDRLRAHLRKNSIETRPFFIPAHTMPMYKEWDRNSYPAADNIAARGINLPSSPILTDQQISFICLQIRNFYGEVVLVV